MVISHFGGTVECKTNETFDSVLNMRYGIGVNEFWISGEKRNPCLAILANENYATLTYFPNGDSAGFQSIGMGTELDLDEVSIFYTNTPDEEMEINNNAVVPFKIALEAAREFFVNLSIPTCLKWSEL